MFLYSIVIVLLFRICFSGLLRQICYTHIRKVVCFSLNFLICLYNFIFFYFHLFFFYILLLLILFRFVIILVRIFRYFALLLQITLLFLLCKIQYHFHHTTFARINITSICFGILLSFFILIFLY